MTREIDRTIRRTWRYWYEDGLAEMAVGCVLVAVGLVFLAEALIPPLFTKVSLSVIGLPLVAIGGGWVASRAVRAAKIRLTYPRTGYVAYRRSRGRRSLRELAVGAVIGVLVGVVFAAAPTSPGWIPALQGLVIGASFLYMGRRLDLGRYHALAVISALVGTAATLGGLGDTLGSAACFGAIGTALIASGAFALRTYLRQTRPLAESQDHGQ